MTRTITAMFTDRATADAAVAQLVKDLGVSRDQVQVHAADAATATTTTTTTNTGAARDEGGFWASLKDLFVPDEDRYAYAEGIRRGHVVVSAAVEEAHLDRAMDVLEKHGAVDLDHQEAEWRQGGWTGYQADTATVASSTSATGMGVVATGAAAGVAAASTATSPAARASDGEVIPIVEESLRIGKRDMERGRVRVRSYVVETPVSEQVTLRQERVEVERRPVDRALTDADRPVFEERTIELTERAEEAVVSKEARVTEELVIRKDATERTETVRDTVRRTEVEVDDTTTDVASTTATGTAAGVSATTAANPPGTVASRAVDQALGTNVSGANPTRKG